MKLPTVIQSLAWPLAAALVSAIALTGCQPKESEPAGEHPTKTEQPAAGEHPTKEGALGKDEHPTKKEDPAKDEHPGN